MLKEARVAAAIPVKDLVRARAFYADKLGLTPVQEVPPGLLYSVGGGTGFLLFKSAGGPSGTHTQMGFEVDDVEAEVRELQSRGVRFEEYDLPGLKTVGGVAQMGGGIKGAWFKDSEGNLLSIGQNVRTRAGLAS